jgi:hypothetical protein
LSLDLRFFEHDNEDPLADLKALPNDKLRKAALWWLKRVRREHSPGKELGYQVSTGDLRGLYKLYVDEDHEPLNPISGSRPIVHQVIRVLATASSTKRSPTTSSGN